MAIPAGFLATPFFAAQFLTIAPPLIRRSPTKDELGASESWFPLVGLALGCLLAGLDAVLSPLLVQPVRDAVLIAALAALTGALHLDGLADAADGIFGGTDPASRLAIMRDPQSGPFGVAAVVLILLIKVSALGSIPPALRPAALVVFPCLGRWAIVAATWGLPYARRDGMGRAFKDGIRFRHALIAAITTAAVCSAAFGIAGAAWLVAATGLVWATGHAVSGRLGGLSGDVYGALCELIEALTLVFLGSRAAEALLG